MSTLVDTNVLLDVLTDDPNHGEWSSIALAEAAERGPLIVNQIIFSEVSIRFSRIEDLDDALPQEHFRRSNLPWEAAFLAGKAWVQYRKNTGARRSPLPDFFIGAHAAVAGFDLLTRDVARYRTYFPTVEVIHPT